MLRALLIIGCCLIPLSVSAKASPSQTELVTTLEQSIGFNAHLSYGDSTYGSTGTYDYQLVETELKYLLGSISPINMRVGFSDGGGNGGASPLSYFEEYAMGDMGYSKVIFDDVVENIDTPADPAGFSEPFLYAQEVNQAVPNSVYSAEGSNENSNVTWVGDTPNTAQAVEDQQRGLVTALNNSIANNQLPPTTQSVYTTGWSSISPEDLTDPVTNGLANYNNAHPYPGFGSGPYSALTEGYQNDGGTIIPAVTTEFGYPVCGITGSIFCSSEPQSGDQPYVNESVRRLYTLDTIMDVNRIGITKLYFYELQNGYAPGSPAFSPWGIFRYDGTFTTSNDNLFNSNGTPNTTYTSATAIVIHNLFVILNDPIGTLQTAAKLDYGTSGLPTTCYGVNSQTTTPCTTKLALEDSSRDYFVVLWAEPQIWNYTTHAQITPSTEIVSLTLPSSGFSSYVEYDPSITIGSDQIGSGAYKSTMSVKVTASPIIIEIKP